jgi:hypothetical protein
MVKSVYTPDLKSVGRKAIPVQVRVEAPNFNKPLHWGFLISEFSLNTAPPLVRELEFSSSRYENPLFINYLRTFSGCASRATMDS